MSTTRSSTKSKKKQKEEIMCKHHVEVESDFTKLIFECKECPGAASLNNEVCMREALGAMGTEFNVDVLIFSDYIETKYVGVAVETLKRTVKILNEIDRFSNRKPWEEYTLSSASELASQKKMCSQCKKRPSVIFGYMKRESEKSLENLYTSFNRVISSLGRPEANKYCQKCIETAKGDMQYLQDMLEELRAYVMYHAFKIVEDET